MSDESLVLIGQQASQLAQIEQGGMGADFGSLLGRVKPATLSINQQNTQAEGAVPGKLRIIDSGDQFDEMIVTFLTMPVERRDYYPGKPGQLNRSKDNLMCFSRNVRRDVRTRKELQGPDEKARMPQAINCANCTKADWTKWRQTKAHEDKPQCDSYFYALFIDTQYKMPLQMWIRSLSKEPFEHGLEQVRRKFMFAQAQGHNPNLFDMQFKLSTKKKVNEGRLPSYTLQMSDFKFVEPEDRQAFGAIYLDWIGAGRPQGDTEDDAQVARQTNIINAEVVAPGSGDVFEGEIVI